MGYFLLLALAALSLARNDFVTATNLDKLDNDRLPDDWLQLGPPCSEERPLAYTSQDHLDMEDATPEESFIEADLSLGNDDPACTHLQVLQLSSWSGHQSALDASSSTTPSSFYSQVARPRATEDSQWYQINSQEEKEPLVRLLKEPWGYDCYSKGDKRTLNHIKQRLTRSDVQQLLYGNDREAKNDIIKKTMPYHRKAEVLEKKQYTQYLASLGMRGGGLRKRVKDALDESARTKEPIWDIIKRKGAAYTPQTRKYSQTILEMGSDDRASSRKEGNPSEL